MGAVVLVHGVVAVRALRTVRRVTGTAGVAGAAGAAWTVLAEVGAEVGTEVRS